MAIIDNTLGFSLKRSLKHIVVDNLSEDVTLVMTATLFLQQNCSNNSFKQVSEPIVVEDVLTIFIPEMDGTYKLRLTFVNGVGDFVYKEFLFSTYRHLLTSFIYDAQQILCDSDCEGCTSVEDVKLLESRVVLQMMTFYIFNKDYYTKFFNLGLDCMKCSLLNILNCNFVDIVFYGKNNEDDTLYKKLIGYMYLIFYFGEKYTYNCCPEEVEETFKTGRIFKCLQNLNIDVDCIETKILEDDTFQISEDNFIDLTPGAGFPTP